MHNIQRAIRLALLNHTRDIDLAGTCSIKLATTLTQSLIPRVFHPDQTYLEKSSQY